MSRTTLKNILLTPTSHDLENMSLNKRLMQIQARKTEFPVFNVPKSKSRPASRQYDIDNDNFLLIKKLSEVTLKPAIVSRAWNHPQTSHKKIRSRKTKRTGESKRYLTLL